jgi:hypothetical protein
MKMTQVAMPAATGLVLYTLGLRETGLLGIVGIALGLFYTVGALVIAWAVYGTRTTDKR